MDRVAGEYLLITARRDTALRPYQLWRRNRDLTGPMLLAHGGTDDTRFLTPVTDGREWAAYVRTESDIVSFVHRLDLSFLGSAYPFIRTGQDRAATRLRPRGSVTFTETATPAHHIYDTWQAAAAAQQLPAPTRAGHFLPRR
ncbi:MAG: hypothetical protein ACI841_001861 [Planctomycetota bacterium]|jgi:hypothetical protein